jgi:hypothetical protein
MSPFVRKYFVLIFSKESSLLASRISIVFRPEASLSSAKQPLNWERCIAESFSFWVQIGVDMRSLGIVEFRHADTSIHITSWLFPGV